MKGEEMEKIHMDLKCKLSSQELECLSQEMARVQRDKELKEAEKKDAASTLGEAVKRLDARLSRLARNIRDKSEVRSVECHKHRLAGNMETIRADTSEVIHTRPLTYDEMQVPLLSTPAKDEGSEPDDVQTEAPGGEPDPLEDTDVSSAAPIA